MRRNYPVRLVLIATKVDDAALVTAAEAGVGGLLRRTEATADTLVRTVERVARGHGEVPRTCWAGYSSKWAAFSGRYWRHGG